MEVREGRGMGGLKSLSEKESAIFWAFTLLAYVFITVSLGFFLKSEFHLDPKVHILFHGAVFIIAILILKRKGISVRRYISKMLKGDIASLLGLFTLIVFLLSLNWLSYYIDEGDLENSLNFLLFSLNVPMLYGIYLSSLPLEKGKINDKPEKRKYLIIALSNLKPSGKEGERELINCILSGNLKECKVNWAPVFRSIEHHLGELRKVFLFISDKSKSDYENLFGKILKEFKKKYRSDFEVEPIGHLDFNDYNKILSEVYKLFIKYNIKDNEISINISPGTSAVSVAFCIAAVRGGRQVEYIRQDNKELVGIDVNERQVARFIGEE